MRALRFFSQEIGREVTARTRPELRDLAVEIESIQDGDASPAWDTDLGFLDWLFDNGIPVNLLGFEARMVVADAVMEAAVDAGTEALVEECRQMLPALGAIRSVSQP